MRYQTKARIQNFIAGLPDVLSGRAYYFVQRRFGSLRQPDTMLNVRKSVRIAAALAPFGGVMDRRLFEVGTGRTIDVPICLWLCGARGTLTVDLNPYLRDELALQSLALLRARATEVAELLGDLRAADFDTRWAALTRCTTVDEIRALTGVEYRSPADATRVDEPAGSFDVHYSTNVFEHVPGDVLREMLVEARRLVRPDGLVAHFVDLSDHFAHSDPTITRVNFLQFDDEAWGRLAGNRYMYQNRLRAPEYVQLFTDAGLRLVQERADVDPPSLAALRAGTITPAARFRAFDAPTLAITALGIVATPA